MNTGSKINKNLAYVEESQEKIEQQKESELNA